jgi:hypothetical protein
VILAVVATHDVGIVQGSYEQRRGGDRCATASCRRESRLARPYQGSKLGADSYIRESKCAENSDLARLVLSVPFAAKRPAPAGGTYSSNPLPSSREAHANLSIEGKPAFREAFQRRRCLVPG